MKKLLFFIFSLLFIFAMVSCNIDSTDSTTPTGPDLYEGDLSSYVTLGEYKNLSITLESIEVTQDLITQRINNDFDSKKTSVDITRPIQNGDRLEIFFEGKIDGVAFEGGKSDNYPMILGSANFIEGFEAGMVGMTVGETKVLSLKFPDDYHQEDYAGKDVEFTVQILKAYKYEYPELTDELVTEVIKTCTTVTQYLEKINTEIENNLKETRDNKKTQDLWAKVVENATVISIPAEKCDPYKNDMISYYSSYATSYGMELGTFLQLYYGMTLDQFYEEAQSYAEYMVTDELVMYSIVHAENLVIGDAEYLEKAEKYVEAEGAESLEDLEENYGKDVILRSLYWDKVIEFLEGVTTFVEP